MVIACLIWGGITMMVRFLTVEMHPFLVVFFRSFFGLVAIAPFMFRAGIVARLGEATRLYLSRAVIGVISMLTWFYAISKIPMAQVTALSFMTPIFVTVAAIVFLGEVVRLRRWTATIIGFLGALLVLRPGIDNVGPGEIAAVASAVAGALVVVFLKKLSHTEGTDRIVALNLVFIVPMALIPALFVWQWPTLEQLMWLVAMGFSATVANWLTVRAFTLGDTTAVQPYDFTRLPFVAGLGFVIFGEVPDVWTWIGGAIIFTSSVYIAHREARLNSGRKIVTTPRIT